MFPTNTTNIHELTRVIESYQDYVTGFAVNICHAAAMKPTEAERDKARLEAGEWIHAHVLALDSMKSALAGFVENTPELLYQLDCTINHFADVMAEWPEELPTPEEVLDAMPNEEEIG